PLGQGVMNSVGMAMAERHLAAIFNQPEQEIVGHYTYAFCSDGDLMEGASHEAASLAGHLGLGKLIWIYDDNHISIEGETEITYSDDVPARFKAYGWQVIDLGEKANDLDAISEGIETARGEPDKPSIIVIRTHIGYGSPNMQDTPDAHGAPLGDDEIKLTKGFYGWPEEKNFWVPEEVKAHMSQAVERGQELEAEWRQAVEKYREDHPELAEQFDACLSGDLPEGWDEEVPQFKPEDGPMATRNAGGDALRGIASRVPWLLGGSADLAPSTKTLLEDTDYFKPGQYENRNVAFGVREHVMCGACSGMALHGGVRPFAATFFVFTDYARPSIRLAAMMELPVIYHMTHDSIGIGEDGPTHQPVEHLASLRAMPNLCVIRPADPTEAAAAWRCAVSRQNSPTLMVLTRQKMDVIDREKYPSADELFKGAYVLSPEEGKEPDIVLMASGSEVALILEAQEDLRENGVDARVVSFPSWELFREQPQDDRDEVIPPNVSARLAVEAGASTGWREWIGDDGETITVDRFGASAPYKDNFEHFGFTVENVVQTACEMQESD
ncbi:MAG: transketolase, partial [Planctomycetes bacterium]|nr:transketolase [Planctomycetota bacterium]